MSVNKVNSDGSLLRVAGGTLYADAPIGTISPFGGSAIPSGYLLCNGNEVLKTAYTELYAVIGDAFGTASDNTKFKLPDLREATTKGVGLSGKSSAHLDADGLAVGEFLDDRVQTHTHDIVCEFGAAGLPDYRPGDTYSQVAGVNAGSRVPIQAININSGRHGATTEVKAVGVNYIIKAKQVAVPFDMAEYVRNQNVRLFRLDGYYLPNAVTVGQFAYAAINTGKTLSQLTNGYLGDTAVDKSRCVINLLYSDGGMALLNTYIYDGKLWIEVYNHWSITRQISRIWLEIIAFPAELTTNV